MKQIIQTETPPNVTMPNIKIKKATSMIPADKLTIDNTIVGVRNLRFLGALQSPSIPSGMPAKNIIVPPHNPISSNNPNKKFEFKRFVGVIDQQITNGINIVNTNSNKNNMM